GDVAANVVEVNVNPLRAGAAQAFGQRCVVIDPPVVAVVADTATTLRGTADDRDRPAAGKLGKLTDEAADGTGRGADDDGLASDGTTDVVQRHECGQAVDAEHARGRGQ